MNITDKKKFPLTHQELYQIIDCKNNFLKFCIDNCKMATPVKCSNFICPHSYRNSIKVINGRFEHKCQYYKCFRRWSARSYLFNYQEKSQIPMEKVI